MARPPEPRARGVRRPVGRNPMVYVRRSMPPGGPCLVCGAFVRAGAACETCAFRRALDDDDADRDDAIGVRGDDPLVGSPADLADRAERQRRLDREIAAWRALHRKR